MPQFVKIEWSGYWDFPSGTYGEGSKEGLPYTGEFPKDLIILNSITGLDFEIDPGKPTYPKSPSPSFMLKNRDNETGIQYYPFSKFSTMGRTVEYGGHDDNFADLFIKISSPLLNDRVLFKGRVQRVQHTKYENEVKVECTDFIGGLSETNRELFNRYPFTQVEVHPDGDESESTTESDILNDFYGITDPIKDHNGVDVEIQRITFRDKFRKFNHVTTGRASLWDENDLENDADFNLYFDEFVTEFLDDFDNGLYERIFIDNEGEAFLTKTYYNTGAEFQGYHLEIDTDPRYVFVQAGKDTILNRVIFQAHFYVIYSTTGSYTNTYMEIGIKTLHMNNGDVETSYQGEEDGLVIFERGRYLKNESDPEDAEYLTSADSGYPDKVDVTIYDWKHYPTENQSFIVEDGWEGYSESTVSDFSTDIIVAGLYFEVVSSELVPKENIGYFNNVESILNSLANNLLDEFSFDSGYSQLFNADRVDYSKYCHCYLSDPIHYNWIGQSFAKALVSTARQISGYLYSNEKGDIILHNRSYYDDSDLGVDPGFYKLEHQYFSQDSPTDRNFGSKFYKISYADLIEVNNIKSSEKFEQTVNNKGIASSFASPQDLDVSNYRTTDLGVPDSQTREAIDGSDSNFKLLRTPIGGNNPAEDFFLMLPEDQAIKYAESFPYPSDMFDVSCDVLKGQSAGLSYADIGIGDYLYTEEEGKQLNPTTDEEEDVYIRKVYLVRRIAYDIPGLLKTSTPVKMTLLYVGKEVEAIL